METKNCDGPEHCDDHYTHPPLDDTKTVKDRLPKRKDQIARELVENIDLDLFDEARESGFDR
jgi:hypothetical protein